MITIHKYHIEAGASKLSMPVGAEILSLQTQRNEACLWALVDTERPLERRTFYAYGTGHHMPTDPGKYIGTFQLNDGNLVFHIFEDVK